MTLMDSEIEKAKLIVNAPLANALSQAGIEFKNAKHSEGGQATYYRLKSCPICSGTRKKKHQFECSFSENRAGNGRFHRAYKCFDGGNEDQNFYWEAMTRLGILTSSQVEFLTTRKTTIAGDKTRRGSAKKTATPKVLLTHTGDSDARPTETETVEIPPMLPMKEADQQVVGIPAFIPPKPPSVVPAEKTSAAKAEAKSVRTFNLEWATRLHRNLLSNEAAMAYCQQRGWDVETVQYFKLGLSLLGETTDKSTGEKYGNSGYLIHPVKSVDGTFIGQYPHHKIPGVTKEANPSRGKTFCSGSTNAYFSARHDSQPYLIVCDGMKDLWSVRQALRGSVYEDKYLVVSSTHGGGNIPVSLRENFFHRFEKVYMAHDNDKPGRDNFGAPTAPAGDMHAIKWAKYAPTNAYRVKLEGDTKDWNDFFAKEGRTLDDFLLLLKDARSMSSIELLDDETISTGRQAYSPVTIEGEYHNGHMYYVTEVMVTADPLPGHLENTTYVETIAIRSDGTEHRARQLPTPAGIRTKPVWQLYPDGAIIPGPLRPNPYATWRYESIERFCLAARQGKSVAPTLSVLIGRIERHLRATTFLPVELDYAILSSAVAASYCQRIFDAVPLLLLTGPAGTGKSQLGKAMSDLAANSPRVTGMPTAASIARQIHESKGFITIDDLESIGQGNKDAEFGDLVQSLKVSYNKATATKTVTNVKKDFIVEHLDFFGIKLINNTSGVGHILGTRMFKIMTRAIPHGVKLPKGLLLPDDISQLRNDLHTWVFENVRQISETYQAIFPSKSTRSEEISAPLRVIATLSGDAHYLARLNEALARQSGLKIEFDTSEDLVDEALRRIIKRSIDMDGEIPLAMSLTQLQLELALLVDVTTYGKESTTQLSDIQKPEWLGRTIMTTYADLSHKPKRTSLFSGKSVRAYVLRREFVSEVVAEYMKDMGKQQDAQPELSYTEEFTGFCQMCEHCVYADRCELREDKQAYMSGLKHKKTVPIKPIH